MDMKPCPFCSETSILVTDEFAFCSRCPAQTSLRYWNMRTEFKPEMETYYRPVFQDSEFNRTFTSDYLYLEPKTEDDRFHDYKLMGWVEEKIKVTRNLKGNGP